eukprot:6193168-Pleurochrysis_carterae.AAC.2
MRVRYGPACIQSEVCALPRPAYPQVIFLSSSQHYDASITIYQALLRYVSSLIFPGTTFYSQNGAFSVRRRRPAESAPSGATARRSP